MEEVKEPTSKLNIVIRVFNSEGVNSNTEIERTYNCNDKLLQSFIDGAIVSILGGDPFTDVITLVPNEKNIDKQ